ncbi:hypothetical protein K445DRAFT_27988 [Daldinia sp. EC12]|nr:hypothetical protein K445DRAFT_27988 [Daldinia sp. EC12]
MFKRRNPVMTANHKHAVVRSYLGDDRFKVQILGPNISASPYIVIAVALPHFPVNIGDIVFLVILEPKPRDALIIRVHKKAEIEALTAQGHLPEKFDLIDDI